jgi:ribosome-binding factor A
MRRVDEAIREVVGEALTGEITDPRLGFVTVTEVRTGSDLRHARVYVSVLGSEQDQADSLVALASSAGVLQAHIGTELRLKRTPTLEFVIDETAERVARLDDLLADEGRRDGH